MKPLKCDLHVHSCLSPCADDDMTPFSIAGMAKVIGLEAVALTDHNTCGNCRTFFDACAHYGIVPIAGMELTTAEEIHVVCLFPDLERAEAFETAFRPHRSPIRNRTAAFGNQLLIGTDDAVLGQEEGLLILASDLDLAAAKALAETYGAAVYPAHIDREANGILGILGGMPDRPQFAAAELHDPGRWDALQTQHGLPNTRIVSVSDAHRLWEMGGCELPVEADCDAVIRYLRGL